MDQTCPICNASLESNAAVCQQCGYRILGKTQSFNALPLNAPSDNSRPDASHQFDLRVVRGPQTGVDIDLKPGILSVGRDPNCDIFLNDMTVSRIHASIEVKSGGCVIRDQNSFNGVWVNNHMVEACSLKPGDVIQIGAFLLVYRERA